MYHVQLVSAVSSNKALFTLAKFEALDTCELTLRFIPGNRSTKVRLHTIESKTNDI